MQLRYGTEIRYHHRIDVVTTQTFLALTLEWIIVFYSRGTISAVA